MNLFQLIQQGQNPQQLAMNLLSQSGSPMMRNLLALAQQGKTDQIEQIARNICQSQGVNFDNEFTKFKQQFGFERRA